MNEEIEILNLFNLITGHKHRAGKANLAGIKRVLKEGYTTEEIQEVIQLKTIEWKNNATMSVHLNPVTLFRDKNFDKYINQVLNVKQNPQMYAEHFKDINNIKTSAADDLDDLKAMFG
jgi:uncharacterized phage protein (TIGR02220 family)